MMRTPAIFIAVAVFAAACGPGEALPRTHYNAGLEALEDGELETAEEQLLEARDGAGSDRELRFRAAMALGLALARRADQARAAEPEKALALLRQSASWYQDAARVKPEHDGARLDLEKVLRRIQILADTLNEKGDLVAALSELIAAQREMLAEIRALVATLDAAGVADPVGHQEHFAGLATRERTLLAELGTLTDRVGDERDGIEQTPEDQRAEEDKARLVQLDAALVYLERARAELASTRRELRRLAAGDALSSAGDGLDELKRAREQLQDPITVLRALTGEELELSSHAAVLAERADGVPAWLTGERLGGRQQAIRRRTTELSLRLAAADPARLPPEAPPAQKRALEAAAAAVPLVRKAEEAMRGAATALESDDAATGLDRSRQAVSLLLEAIELFADIRTLVELTHQSHSAAAAAIDSKEDGAAEVLRAQTDKTAERLSRLEGLIAAQKATLQAQQQQAQQAQGQGGAPPQGDAGQAELQRLTRAEELRAQAASAVEEMRTALGSGGDVAAPAGRAKTSIDELRRLFFSIVQHLEELRNQQAETHDRSASAESMDDQRKAAELSPLALAQSQHLQRAEALSQALSQQAEAASQSQDPGAAQQAEALTGAAEEMRKAQIAMDNAAGGLDAAAADAETMSVTLGPILEQQPVAIEHIEEAIRLLKPPQQQKQDPKDQQDQQDQKDQQDQDQQDQQQPGDSAQPQELSEQEAERRLEAIRQREAERRRRKRERERPDSAVEKDW